MVLRDSRYGLFYGCKSFPECRASHGAHPDGRPLGVPGDAETKAARIHAHDLFDRIWREGLKRNRGAAYAWMQGVMGLTRDEAHIGAFSREQCEELVRVILNRWPHLKEEPKHGTST